MIQIPGRVSQAGLDVLGLEVGIVGQDFCRRGPANQHVEDILDPDAHTTDAGAASALLRVDGDAVHVGKLSAGESHKQGWSPPEADSFLFSVGSFQPRTK